MSSTPEVVNKYQFAGGVANGKEPFRPPAIAVFARVQPGPPGALPEINSCRRFICREPGGIVTQDLFSYT